jgi:fructosamine-3-kinase
MNLSQLQAFLSQKLQTPVIKIQAVGGGCINQTYKIVTANNQFFCKTNSASKFPHLLEKEKKGLELIQKHKHIKTPSIINYSIEADEQVLILEWIEEGSRTNQFWKTFGKELAALHSVSNEFYGLEEDNFMGSVPQSNKQEKRWVSFFIEQRLQPLQKLCIDAQHLTLKHVAQFESLYKYLPAIFNKEKPSLLHGDLWSGNFMCTKESKLVVIDPAVYFGHRSVDLAMTTLFGGFDKSFYEAYHYHFPFPDNYPEQWKVCNLYPLLIHLFLFGRAYLHQVEEVLKKYSA